MQEQSERATAVRHEEELDVRAETVEFGSVVLRKDVETHEVEDVVPVGMEHASVDRAPAAEEDSGEIETLADGTISVPIFEEEIVVTKRLRVRERVLIRKTTETRDEIVRGEVRVERFDVVATGHADVRETTASDADRVAE